MSCWPNFILNELESKFPIGDFGLHYKDRLLIKNNPDKFLNAINILLCDIESKSISGYYYLKKEILICINLALYFGYNMQHETSEVIDMMSILHTDYSCKVEFNKEAISIITSFLKYLQHVFNNIEIYTHRNDFDLNKFEQMLLYNDNKTPTSIIKELNNLDFYTAGLHKNCSRLLITTHIYNKDEFMEFLRKNNLVQLLSIIDYIDYEQTTKRHPKLKDQLYIEHD